MVLIQVISSVEGDGRNFAEVGTHALGQALQQALGEGGPDCPPLPSHHHPVRHPTTIATPIYCRASTWFNCWCW